MIEYQTFVFSTLNADICNTMFINIPDRLIYFINSIEPRLKNIMHPEKHS